MADTQSPFDLPASADEADDPSRLPERKWSFIGLAAVLFVLVWVRELAQLPAAVTLSLAALVLLGWLVVHVTWFTTFPEMARELPHEAAQSFSRDELTHPSAMEVQVNAADVGAIERELARRRRERRRNRNWLWFGMLVGVWAAYLIPLGLFGLTVVLLAIYAGTTLASAFASRS